MEMRLALHLAAVIGADTIAGDLAKGMLARLFSCTDYLVA